MGQMHVQLAVENEHGPATIVVSDLDNERLGKLQSRLAHKVSARGVEVHYLNPGEFANEEAFNARLQGLAPRGFDDIVMLVPVPAIFNACARRLGENGLMNVFAGIPAGNTATLDMGGVVARAQRCVASSGSSMADIRPRSN